MRHLEAYHLSSAETKEDREDRIRMDRTCMACGYDYINGPHNDCPGYPN